MSARLEIAGAIVVVELVLIGGWIHARRVRDEYLNGKRERGD